MRVNRRPRIECIILMMHLMDLVQRSIVDCSMEEVEDDILEVINEKNLQEEFRIGREVLET